MMNWVPEMGQDKKIHIGGGWDMFVCVSETVSVITTCIDIHTTTEGAAKQCGSQNEQSRLGTC